MAQFEVLIDDNFHYMDLEHRRSGGLFATKAEATAESKRIVDNCLQELMQPGRDAATLLEHYHAFGDDPFIVARDDLDEAPIDDARFSAWEYAEERRGAVAASAAATVIDGDLRDCSDHLRRVLAGVVGSDTVLTQD
jgi:hypothetical protein